MNRKCILYKNVHVSPGTKLYEALLAKDKKLIERLYKDIEQRFTAERS